MVQRFQLGLGQLAIVLIAGVIAVPVAVARIVGKFAAAVFGVFVKVDVAQVHLGIGRCRAKGAVVAARCHVNVARRLRAKACTVGVPGQCSALLGDDVVGHGGVYSAGCHCKAVQCKQRGSGCGQHREGSFDHDDFQYFLR